MNSTEEKYNIAQDRRIDTSDIMRSLFDQADKYFKYAEGYMNAKAKRNRTEALNEIVFGEIELKIRANPQKFGIEDVKEAAIKAVVRNDKRWKIALNKYYDLVDETAKYKAAMLSMEQRSYMLTNIVTNLATGVRSVPKVILDDTKVKEVEKDAMERSQVEHLKTTRKEKK